MKKILGILLILYTVCIALVCFGETSGETVLSHEGAMKLTNGQDIRTIIIPEGIQRIEAEAFAGIAIERVTLPISLKYIANDAFDTSVVFIVHKDSEAERWVERNELIYTIIEEEQEDLFDVLKFRPDPEDEQQRLIITKYTGEASTLILPDEIDGVKIYRIGKEAFAYNETLKILRFPIYLEQIDSRAFYNTQIKSLILPESVNFVGGFAFAECHALTKIVLPEKLENAVLEPFINCEALKEVTMSVNFQNNRAGFRGCENVETIHYLAGTSGRFLLQVGNNGSYLEYQSKRTLKTIDFEEGITAVGDQAFLNDKYDNENNCFMLTQIQLPSTMKEIGDSAFSGLSCLTEVNLPDGLERIGNEAFAHCRSLVPPEIPSSVINPPDDIFIDCWSPEE